MKPLATLAIALILVTIATTAATWADLLLIKLKAKTGTIDLNLQNTSYSCGNRNTDVTISSAKTDNSYTITIKVDPPGRSADSCTITLNFKNIGTIPIKIHTSTSYTGTGSCTSNPTTTGTVDPAGTTSVNIYVSGCQGNCTCTATVTASPWNQ